MKLSLLAGPASDIPSPSSQSDGGSAPSTPRPTTPPTPERGEFFLKPDKYFVSYNHMVLADAGKHTSEYSVKFKWKYEDQILTQIDI